jgi:hypothetical protein
VIYDKILLYGQAAVITGLSATAHQTLINVEVVATGVVTFVGAWALLQAKKMLDRLNKMIDEFPNVLAALYGPTDDRGVRIGDGLVKKTDNLIVSVASVSEQVERIPEIEQKIDEAIQVANESRSAARLVAEELNSMPHNRSPTERTRHTDHGGKR